MIFFYPPALFRNLLFLPSANQRGPFPLTNQRSPPTPRAWRTSCAAAVSPPLQGQLARQTATAVAYARCSWALLPAPRSPSQNVIVSKNQCCGSGSESGSVGSIWFWASRVSSISQRSGSRSFYIQAKIVRQNIDSYCFVTSWWLFIFENDVPSKINMQKKLMSWRSLTKIAGSGSGSIS